MEKNIIINVFWVLVGVGITLYANREIPKIHAKKRLKAIDKHRDLNNDFENSKRMMAPYAKTARISTPWYANHLEKLGN